MPIRQVDLGRATGLRRETINRLLKTWVKEKRLAVSARGLSNIQPARLEEIVSNRNPAAMLQTLVSA